MERFQTGFETLHLGDIIPRKWVSKEQDERVQVIHSRVQCTLTCPSDCRAEGFSETIYITIGFKKLLFTKSYDAANRRARTYQVLNRYKS